MNGEQSGERDYFLIYLLRTRNRKCVVCLFDMTPPPHNMNTAVIQQSCNLRRAQRGVTLSLQQNTLVASGLNTTC